VLLHRVAEMCPWLPRHLPHARIIMSARWKATGPAAEAEAERYPPETAHRSAAEISTGASAAWLPGARPGPLMGAGPRHCHWLTASLLQEVNGRGRDPGGGAPFRGAAMLCAGAHDVYNAARQCSCTSAATVCRDPEVPNPEVPNKWGVNCSDWSIGRAGRCSLFFPGCKFPFPTCGADTVNTDETGSAWVCRWIPRVGGPSGVPSDT
jgi:hypothetical protein